MHLCGKLLLHVFKHIVLNFFSMQTNSCQFFSLSFNDKFALDCIVGWVANANNWYCKFATPDKSTLVTNSKILGFYGKNYQVVLEHLRLLPFDLPKGHEDSYINSM